MMKWLLLLIPATLCAQNPILSGTVASGVDGCVYGNGSYNLNMIDGNGNDMTPGYIVYVGGIPISIRNLQGTLDGFGHFSQPVMSNASISTPAGTQWKLNICSQTAPGAPPQRCFKYTTPVSANLDLTSALTSIAPPLGCPGGNPNAVLKNTTSPQTMLGPLNTPALNTIVYPVPGTGTISTAIAAAPSGITIQLQCGTYTDNLHITTSNIILQGAGVNCTTLQPTTSADMVSVDSTGGAIQYFQMRDLTLNNTGAFSSSDGFVITGPVNQINDWHHLENINIQGFRHGINLSGRTIWSTFENVHIGASLSDGIYAVTAAVLNHIAFRDGQINNSQGYGVNWQNSNTNASLSTEWDHVNVENNGASGTLANCAGMLISGVGTMSIHDGYFEANCTTTPDSLGADIRITGTFAQALDIRSNLIWSVTNFGIWNDAIQTTGEYSGNKIVNQTTKTVKIQTTNSLSNILIGPNLIGGDMLIIPDGGGNTHTTLDGSYAIAQTWYGNLTVPNFVATGTITGFTINYTNFLQFNGTSISPAITTFGSPPTVGQAACIKSTGPPVTIGYCSTVVGAGGACTCN